MAGGPGPVFLARRGYRRRRLGDAARVLPVLGVVLFALPATGAVPEGAAGFVYLFAAWAGLIAMAAALARLLGRPDAEPGAPDPDEPSARPRTRE